MHAQNMDERRASAYLETTKKKKENVKEGMIL